MLRSSSALSRVLWQVVLSMAVITAVFFALSSYYYNDTYIATHTAALESALAQGRGVLDRCARGEMTAEELKSAVNPPLTVDSGFFMLLGRDRQVLAYTEGAAPYFAGDTLSRLLDQLQSENSAVTRARENGTTVLLMAEGSDSGYVIAGRPLQAFNSAAVSFRTRLLISMLLSAALILLVSAFLARQASRPARIISEMAGRLAQGEQVTLPENLPGKDTREIAVALNDMSRTVAQAIGELKYEKETLGLILEGLKEGILAIDEKGGILHQNAAAWALLGGGETESCLAVMAALREDRPQEQWDAKIIDGSRVLFCAVSRLPAAGGRASRGTVALIRDVTEEERLERTRHDYVANISHELRTPLSSIRGLAEGLRDGMVTEEGDRSRYYSIIVEESNRLSRLVNDLLELSSLQSNPAAFETETIDPNELIWEMHDRNQSLFEKKGVHFLLSLPDAALPAIRSNEDRLAQVLTIFLDNARKYTPAGGEAVLGAEGREGAVRFFVRDTGVGMDEETCRLAFDRFHQAERSHSDEGSGLGLSIAREILQKMNVSIQLKSAPGRGSEFSFLIPTA